MDASLQHSTVDLAQRCRAVPTEVTGRLLDAAVSFVRASRVRRHPSQRDRSTGGIDHRSDLRALALQNRSASRGRRPCPLRDPAGAQAQGSRRSPHAPTRHDRNVQLGRRRGRPGPRRDDPSRRQRSRQRRHRGVAGRVPQPRRHSSSAASSRREKTPGPSTPTSTRPRWLCCAKPSGSALTWCYQRDSTSPMFPPKTTGTLLLSS